MSNDAIHGDAPLHVNDTIRWQEGIETVVRPAFTGTEGIVYVLPETRPAREVFGSYDVDERAARQNVEAATPR